MPKSANEPAIRGTALTIAFGLVNVPVKIGPAAGAASTVPGGKFVCPCHGEAIVSTRCCATSGEEVKPETGFLYEGKLVTGINRNDYRAVKDGSLKLEGVVDLEHLDPLYYEQTQLIWPQAGGEQAYDLLVAALKGSGKALIGKAALTTSTRIIAVRYSPATSTLVAHVLSFAATIRWNDAATIAAFADKRPEPTEAETDLAGQLLATLDDVEAGTFLDDFSDDYGDNLTAAIAAKAEGLEAPVVKAEEPAAPTTDLLATLQASLAGAKKPAAKPKRKAKAKA